MYIWKIILCHLGSRCTCSYIWILRMVYFSVKDSHLCYKFYLLYSPSYQETRVCYPWTLQIPHAYHNTCGKPGKNKLNWFVTRQTTVIHTYILHINIHTHIALFWLEFILWPWYIILIQLLVTPLNSGSLITILQYKGRANYNAQVTGA